MKNFKIILFLNCFFVLQSSLFAVDIKSVSESSGATNVMTLDSLGVHPSLLFNKQKIDRIKLAIEAKKEPFNSAKVYLISYCNAKLSYVPVPYTGNNSNDYYLQMLLPASIVRNLSLAYQLTGNPVYGEKAVAMLKQFAVACTGKLFDINVDYPAQSMKVARASFPFVCAYDMLINTGLIDQTTKAEIHAWFRQIEKQVKDGEQEWIKNDYFSKQYYNNHLVAHTMSLLAIGCALDDPALVQYAVQSQACPRDVMELIPGMILMSGDTDCVRVKNLPKEDGEIMDRFRHFTAPKKGLQYASLVLNLLSPIALICDHHGWNLFEYTAPTGENLLLSYNYYSDYWRTKDSSIKNGYYTGEDARLASNEDWIGNFEVALTYYPNSQQLKDVVASYNRATQHIDLLGYTAFFADPSLTFSDTKETEAYKDKLKVFVSGNSIYLQNTTNEQGELFIYNTLGQLIAESSFGSEAQSSVDTNIGQGIYLTRAVTSCGMTFTNTIIKK